MLTLRGPAEPRRGPALNQLSIIPDGSLLIRDGVLVEIGTTRRVENLALARQAIEVSASGRVVMPGFVDSHTHLLFPPPGSLNSGFKASTRTLNAMTGMRLKVRARALLETMARHGTTTVEVKTGCGPDESAEMKVLRVLAELKEELLDVVASVLFRASPGQGTTDQGSEQACHFAWSMFLPKVRRRRLARFADVACESAGCVSRYLEAARVLGLGGKVHADGAAPSAVIAAAIEGGAASIDHLENATRADVAQLGRAKSIATLVPSASFHDGGRFAPARALIDAGAPVAVASNFNSLHTPGLSMQVAVSLACRYLGMTAAEAISAATINGAHALGCASKVGSLEPGKQADLLVCNVSDYRELAFGFGANLVHMVMKRGEFIYEEGEVARRPAEDLRPSW